MHLNIKLIYELWILAIEKCHERNFNGKLTHQGWPRFVIFQRGSKVPFALIFHKTDSLQYNVYHENICVETSECTIVHLFLHSLYCILEESHNSNYSSIGKIKIFKLLGWFLLYYIHISLDSFSTFEDKNWRWIFRILQLLIFNMSIIKVSINLSFKSFEIKI